jgi:FMN phosphatase YigB (HAD superfamily)
MACESETKIRVVIFDVGGVLANNLQWYNGWGEWFDESLHDEVEDARKAAWLEIKVGGCSLQDFWTRCLSAAKVNEGEQGHSWQEADANLSSQFHPYYFTLAIAQRLKERGYTIGICSNHALEWFTTIVDRFRLRDVFDDESLVIASYAVSCAKPSKEIFDVVMSRLRAKHADIKESEVAFVDDQAKNTSVAAALGINAVLYDAAVDGQQGLVDKLSAIGVDCRLK